jgi:hypothetical protein
MKKEKKVKLFVNESDAPATKKLLTDKKIQWWNATTHFQFDLTTCIITATVMIIFFVAIAI